jgi:hypothetical protein
MFGTHDYDDRGCGVRLYATVSGALLFANVDPYVATVISAEVLAKVMRRHPVDDSFARTMLDSGVQDSDDPMYGSARTTPACRRDWFSVSRPLADKSLPPADARFGPMARTKPIPEHHREHPHSPMGVENRLYPE